MISALTIANFKAFADTQRIPLRPLTLIYGANSSGKSSIIHSMLLVKEALEQGELDIHRTKSGGESVDLGGFRQYVHRREVSRRIEWSAELSTRGFGGRLGELLTAVDSVSVRVSVGMALDDKGQPRAGASPEVYSFELYGDAKPLLTMSRRSDGGLQLDSLDYEHRLLKEVLKALIQTSTTTETLTQDEFTALSDAVSELVPSLEARQGAFLPPGLALQLTFDENTQQLLFPISRGSRKEDLASAVRFFLPRTLDDLISGVNSTIRKELSTLKYLGPLRSYPPRHLAFTPHQDANWFAGGGYAWDVVRRDARVRNLVNDWLRAPNRLQTPYELILRDLVAVSDIEAPLLVSLDNLSELFSDELTELPEDESLYAKSANPIEDTEKEAQKFLANIRSADIERLHELILLDRRSNTIVSHRDVGIGVSQVLPVLVSAFGSHHSIIAIEQPELHLHPAVQADLGDVFLNSALGHTRNRFVIETHSEHLLLRIMRRMRETFDQKLSEGSRPVKPEDVMVLFVEPLGSHSIIREMPLNERGELVKAWPGGFFEEGLREVF